MVRDTKVTLITQMRGMLSEATLHISLWLRRQRRRGRRSKRKRERGGRRGRDKEDEEEEERGRRKKRKREGGGRRGREKEEEEERGRGKKRKREGGGRRVGEIGEGKDKATWMCTYNSLGLNQCSIKSVLPSDIIYYTYIKVFILSGQKLEPPTSTYISPYRF